MKIGSGEKLLFIGDSITDCGRARPEGEGSFGALGTGYVAYVVGLLQAVYPELGIRVVNKGISGNTVRDLKREMGRRCHCPKTRLGINHDRH